MRAGDHTTHLLEGCRVQIVSPAASEERATSTVIKRLLSESPDGTISVSTSGKVLVNKLWFLKYMHDYFTATYFGPSVALVCLNV